MNLKQKLTPLTSQVISPVITHATKGLFVLALTVPMLAALIVPINSSADILNLGSQPTVLMKSNAPRAGMTMSRVLKKFGQPAKRKTAPGKVTSRNPLITKWHYGNTIVYFENKHVIHTVIRR